MASETRLQRTIKWFQDHRVFSCVSFLFVILVALGTVIGAIDNIVGFSRKYLFLAQKPEVQIKTNEMIPMLKDGFGYQYFGALERLGLSTPDTLDRNNNSQLVLREDGRPLGPAHSGHKDIEDFGRGRYSHWLDNKSGEYLYFSTSDNTDPRKNGRTYTVTVPGRDERAITLDAREIKEADARSAGYRYNGPGLGVSPADSSAQQRISRLVLLENGKRLGPGHSPPGEVRDIGKGRYSHWHDGQAEWLFFSTSDNSDPRENGRRYTITVDG
jgi:hypothetical protein